MEKQLFQSDLVAFTVERKPHCVVEYHVTAQPPIVAKARESALRTVRKHAAIPGFRKGKAPHQMVAQKYPKELEKEWKSQLADLCFAACQKIHSTPPLEHDTEVFFQIQNQNFSLDAEAKMLFSFETNPIAPSVDPKEIALETIAVKSIDEKEIDATIAQIQEFFTSWETKLEDPLEWGNRATINIDLLEGDAPEEIVRNAQIILDKDKTTKWMREILLGMRSGESKEGVSQPDPDASAEEKKDFPPKNVRVTVMKTEVAHVPPVDDQLANKVGTSAVEDMRQAIAKMLEKRAKNAAQRAYRDQVEAHLLSHYSFDLPKTLVEREMQSRIKQVVANPSSQNKLLSMTDEEKQKLALDLERRGRDALSLFFLSRQIIDDHHLVISPKELEEDTHKTFLELMFLDPSHDLYHEKKPSREQKALAFARLSLEKAEDFLIQGATFVPPKTIKVAESPSPDKTKEVVEKKTPETEVNP